MSQHVKTFFMLRRIVWILGIGLILALPLLGCIVTDQVCIKPSLSAYYHVDDWTRNIFVGVLFAVGACLIAYKGFDETEDTLLDIAGLAAPLIALFPAKTGDAPSDAISYVHNVAAIVFFLSIACVAARPQRHVLKELPEEQRRKFRTRYRWAARGMIVGPALAVIFAYAVGRETFGVVIGEVVAILAFSYYWLTKNREMKLSQADEKALGRTDLVPAERPVSQEVQDIGRELMTIIGSAD